MSAEPRPPPESLWILAAGPLIWLAHFLLAYVTAAIWCAKHSHDGSLGAARAAIAAYTALALGALALVGWRALRRRPFGAGPPLREYDRPADRDRFLGRATLLIAGLSTI